MSTLDQRTNLSFGVAFILVCLGGAAGAALRAVLTAVPTLGIDNAAIALGIVNTVGAFALGVVSQFFIRRPGSPLKPLLATGLLGGFTSFSSLAAVGAEPVLWIPTNDFSLFSGSLLALVWVGVVVLTSLIAGLIAAWLGLLLGKKLFQEAEQ